jgi:hypothetical protein
MMAENAPLYEATTMEATTAISGLEKSLNAVKPLGMVFPKAESGGSTYRIGESSGMQDFPQNLASVIYAAFHKDDDPEFYKAICASAAYGRYDYDPKTGRFTPTEFNFEGRPVEGRINQSSMYGQKPSIAGFNRDDQSKGEERDIVIGYLLHPEKLVNASKTFSEALHNVLEYAAPEGTDMPLLDKLKGIKDRIRSKYVSDLMRLRGVRGAGTATPNALVSPQDRKTREANGLRTASISEDEIYAYLACNMAEDFANDILAAAEEASSGNAKGTVQVQDVLDFAEQWVGNNGSGARIKREKRTGDDAVDYEPLDVKTRNDLINAPVAPEFVIPMFAQNVGCFSAVDVKGTAALEDARMGYRTIGRALGVKLPPEPTGKDGASASPEALVEFNEGARESINEFLAELAEDTDRAKEVRERAVEYVNAAAIPDSLKKRILTNVFQIKKGQLYTKYPSIAGTADEFRYRKTGVGLGKISSKITDIYNPNEGLFKVVADNHPGQDGWKSNDEFTVDLDGIRKSVSRTDDDTLHNYERPALVEYVDTDRSFATYAIWKGIVPYSKIEDNRATYDIGQSAETKEARAASAGDTVLDTMKGVENRGTFASLTGSTAAGSDESLGSNDAEVRTNLTKIASELGAFGVGENALFGNPKVNRLDNENLRNYLMLAAIDNYTSRLSSYMNRNLTEDSAQLKAAFMAVMGNPKIILGNASNADILEQIVDKLDEFSAATEAGGGDFGTGREIARSYLSTFFDNIDSQNVPGMLAETYGVGSDSLAAALAAYDADLANAAKSICAGYGYIGLKQTSDYVGGKYGSGNQVAIESPANYNSPAGGFRETPKVHEARGSLRTIVERVGELVAAAKADPTSSLAKMEKIASGVKSSGLVDASAMDRAEADAKKVLGVAGGTTVAKPVETVYALAYAVLKGMLSGNGRIRKLTEHINKVIKPVGGRLSRRMRESIGKLEKNMMDRAGDFGKALGTLGVIHKLSAGGNDFKPIHDIAREDANPHTFTMYGALVSAVRTCRDMAKKMGNLSDDLIDRVTVDVGGRPNVGEPESNTLGEEGLKDVQVPPEESSGISDRVEQRAKEWQPSDETNTYLGFSGYMGIDTVKRGPHEVEDAKTMDLANVEVATTGLSKAALIDCVRMIDDARSIIAKENRSGEMGSMARKYSNPEMWASSIVATAGDYMESNLRIVAPDYTRTATGAHELSPEVAESWKEIADNTLDGIKAKCTQTADARMAAVANKVQALLDRLVVNPRTLEDVSNVSTALANIIRYVGEYMYDVSMPDPVSGQFNKHLSPTKEMIRMASMRSMPGQSVRGQLSDEGAASAANFVRSVGNSIDGAGELAETLANLYAIYGRGDTEGYDTALGAMRAGEHAAENKTDRVKTALHGGKAPTEFAAMLYNRVFESEANNDRAYGSVVDAIKAVAAGNPLTTAEANVTEGRYDSEATQEVSIDSNGRLAKTNENGEVIDRAEPDVMDDIFHMAGLNGTVQNGPMKGRTYASCGFGNASMAEMPLDEIDGKVGRALATALRVQMVDRLLSDRTFNNLRNNSELWGKLVNMFSELAFDLDGVAAALLFATLDYPILNAAQEARQARLRKAAKEDTALGEDVIAERLSQQRSGSENMRIKPLAVAIMKGLFGANETLRSEGMEELTRILGDEPTQRFLSSLDKNELSEFSIKQKTAFSNAKAKELIEQYGKSASEKMFANASDDEKMARALTTIRSAIDSVAYGKTVAGHTPDDYYKNIIPGLIGKDLSEALLRPFVGAYDNAKNRDTVDQVISRLMYSLTHSNSAIYTALKRTLGIGVDSKSSLARTDRDRELRGDTAGASRSMNMGAWEKLSEHIKEKLEKFDVKNSDAAERMALGRSLRELGFESDVNAFCSDVMGNPDRQADIADKYAKNPDNYSDELRKHLEGALGTLTPTSEHPTEQLVVDIARRMEGMEPPLRGMNIVRDADGRERPFVKFANSKSARDMEYAQMQLGILMGMFKKTYGHPLVGANGNVSDDDLKKLDQLIGGSDVPFPVDPTASLREVNNLVINVINNVASQKGHPWIKAVGGAAPNRVFERHVERQDKAGTNEMKNSFTVRLAEGYITKIVKNFMREHDLPFSKIVAEQKRLETLKKGEVKGELSMMAAEVQKRINDIVERAIKAMVRSGNTVYAKDGLTVKWDNPPKKPAAEDYVG